MAWLSRLSHSHELQLSQSTGLYRAIISNSARTQYIRFRRLEANIDV
jgi:hypothetical protein